MPTSAHNYVLSRVKLQYCFANLPSYPPNTSHGNTGPPNVPKQGSWSKLVSFSDAGALKKSPVASVSFCLTTEAQHHRTKKGRELSCCVITDDTSGEKWSKTASDTLPLCYICFEFKYNFKGVFLVAKMRSSFYPTEVKAEEKTVSTEPYFSKVIEIHLR